MSAKREGLDREPRERKEFKMSLGQNTILRHADIETPLVHLNLETRTLYTLDIRKKRFQSSYPRGLFFSTFSNLQPLPKPGIRSFSEETPCLEPMKSSSLEAMKLSSLEDAFASTGIQGLSVMSSNSETCFPEREFPKWTNEDIGRHVKHLCMGTRGGSLDLSALNHVTKLKTLKIHSRNAIVGREGISKNEFANFCA